MNPTLSVSLLAFLPAGCLFVAAFLLFRRARTPATCLQLLGAAGFILVALAHLCEGFGLFPVMGWGEPHSVGHYLDLAGALSGIVAFPLGYLLHVLERKRSA